MVGVTKVLILTSFCTPNPHNDPGFLQWRICDSERVSDYLPTPGLVNLKAHGFLTAQVLFRKEAFVEEVEFELDLEEWAGLDRPWVCVG